MFRSSEPISSLTVSPTLANCEAAEKRAFSGGSLQLPVNTSVTTITVYGSLDDGASWGIVRDEAGVALRMTVVPSATEPAMVGIPDECYKYPLLKFRSQAGAGDEEARIFKIT